MSTRHVVVIGGGITGLAAAHRLHALAPHVEIAVVEQANRLGGKILTERVDGFTIEAGPDSFLSAKPRGVGLCEELGLAGELQGTIPENRGSFVLRQGRLYALPEGLTGLVPTRLAPMAKTRLISPRGKARMALDYVLPSRRDDGDESLAAFVERRLGRELYDRLIEPLMGGIYAGDGAQLSLAATFPQLRQAELRHGGLIKGVLAAKQASSAAANGAEPRPGFLAPVSGLQVMVGALVARLREAQVRLLTGTGVTGLRPTAVGGYDVVLGDGGALQADAVILATPACAAAEIVAGFAPEAADLLRSIPYVSTATVSLAYPRDAVPHPLRGYGYVVPRAEGRPVLACTWVSSKWAHRAAPGQVLLRAFVGRAGYEDALAGSDEALLSLARDELRSVLGITAAPSLTRVFRWPRAMPQYTLGHLDRVAAIERHLTAHPGLTLAGAAYRGVGIPDCIAAGEAAAERVAANS